MRYQFHNGVKPNRCNGKMVLIKIVLIPLAISAVFFPALRKILHLKKRMMNVHITDHLLASEVPD